MKSRYLTALRLLAHWSTGMVMGSLITYNGWNKWAIAFLVLHLFIQVCYTLVDSFIENKSVLKSGR